MSYNKENLDLETITKERRETIAESIRPISVDELQKLGEELFPFSDHPWRQVFFAFIEENSSATFHHAITDDRIHIIYCAAKDKGMWFLPGSGMGPLQERGRKILGEIVKAKP